MQEADLIKDNDDHTMDHQEDQLLVELLKWILKNIQERFTVKVGLVSFL